MVIERNKSEPTQEKSEPVAQAPIAPDPVEEVEDAVTEEVSDEDVTEVPSDEEDV